MYVIVIGEQSGVDFTNVLQTALHTQIPKVQKDTNDVTVFLRFWDLLT